MPTENELIEKFSAWYTKFESENEIKFDEDPMYVMFLAWKAGLKEANTRKEAYNENTPYIFDYRNPF